MKNKITIFILSLILAVSVFVSYRFNVSLQQQSLLLNEFNKYNLTAPLGLIESFNDDFPSITNTTLPLATLKGKYYLRDSMIDKALIYFHKGKHQNKFIKLSEFELAKYYYNINEIDSAYYYSKLAFNALPRNVLYLNTYFKTLTKLKYSKELDSAFSKIKGYKIFDQWSLYIFAKLETKPESKKELIVTLNELKDFATNSSRIKTMESIINIGYENLNELGGIVLKAEELFEKGDFFDAAMLELKASNLDPPRLCPPRKCSNLIL